MTASTDDVRLQVLVRAPWRNERGLADVEAALRALGFEITGKGKASLSVRATPAAFAAAFGRAPASARHRGPAEASPALPVPASLAERVESITVAPIHIVMGRSARRRNREGEP